MNTSGTARPRKLVLRYGGCSTPEGIHYNAPNEAVLAANVMAAGWSTQKGEAERIGRVAAGSAYPFLELPVIVLDRQD